MNNPVEPSPGPAHERYQDHALAGVSRTFALTIPELPDGLRRAVGNAYLLCRIADTIEDDPGVCAGEKERFHAWLVDLIDGRGDAPEFAAGLHRLLSSCSSEEERELVRNTGRVVAITSELPAGTRETLKHGVAVMCRGMPAFQRRPRAQGLEDLAAMDQYCYYVAGVVGIMLTELFCDYSSQIRRRRCGLLDLAASFGQGLQMTNILKDVWDDHARGVCWLPRDVFDKHGYDLHALHPDHERHAFAAGLRDLISVAHGHLRNALEYTLLIPANESGIRRFCLWSLVLAVHTLQGVHANPGFRDSAQIKVSRRTVRRTVRITRSVCRSNLLVRGLFAWSARGLPLRSRVTTFRDMKGAVATSS